MAQKQQTPAPKTSQGSAVFPNESRKDAASGINIALDGVRENSVLPPSATERWDEDRACMVPIGTLDTDPLPPEAEHLRDRLIAQPKHPLEPQALLSELHTVGIGWDAIKAMVPNWPGLATLNKITLDHVMRRAKVFQDKDKEPLRRYQARYFVLKEFGGKVRLCWFDRNGNFRHRSPQSWREAETTVRIDIDDGKGGKTSKPAADFWYHSADRNEYETAEFRPGERTPPDILNLWQGWSVGMYHDGTPNKPEALLTHIRDNMCCGDEEVFEWFMGWMADAVQNVGRTAGTAVVLRGPEGSGKNFWADRFMELFAPHTLMLTSSKQLTGNFNSHLMDKLVVFANEAFFAGNRADAAALKALVTDSTMIVEPKGVDAFQVRKNFRLIIASNDEHVVRVSESDRRYFVLEVDAQENNNSRDYFGEIAEEWQNGGREQFLTLLWNWNLSGWDEGQIPETAARTSQREYSLGEADRWLLELLAVGEVPAAAHDPDLGHVFITSEDLPSKSKAYGAALRAAGAFAGDNCRETIGGGQRRGYWLPQLAEARRHFAQEKGVRSEWLSVGESAEWTFAVNRLVIPASEKPSKLKALF